MMKMLYQKKNTLYTTHIMDTTDVTPPPLTEEKEEEEVSGQIYFAGPSRCSVRFVQGLCGCISVCMCALVHVCVCALIVALKGRRAGRMVGGEWGSV